MNYKHQRTGEVISEQCYNKLPFEKKSQYSSVYDQPTHRVSDDSGDDFLTTAITAEAISSMMDFGSSDTSSSFGSSSSGSDFGGFGGGDTGGGGTSGDW